MSPAITEHLAHLRVSPHKSKIYLQIVKGRRQTNQSWSIGKFSLESPRILLYFTLEFPSGKSWVTGYSQTWPGPERFMIQLLSWPEQNPSAEGQSQAAHTAPQLKQRCPHTWMWDKTSSPAPCKREHGPVAHGTYGRDGKHESHNCFCTLFGSSLMYNTIRASRSRAGAQPISALAKCPDCCAEWRARAVAGRHSKYAHFIGHLTV